MDGLRKFVAIQPGNNPRRCQVPVSSIINGPCVTNDSDDFAVGGRGTIDDCTWKSSWRRRKPALIS